MISSPPVFFLTTGELQKVLRTQSSCKEFALRSVFSLQPFVFEDPGELCQFYVSDKCRFEGKCKNYHPIQVSEAECMLCKVKIRASLRKFGLLSGCNDIFCFPCIRHWRSRGNVSQDLSKSCPVCSRVSQVLVPSSIFPKDPKEKKDLVKVLSIFCLKSK